ncbi:MAG: sugar transferase [Acidobacteriia bacterium]|nr:sugar transferase [Terriglobia bacterium]
MIRIFRAFVPASTLVLLVSEILIVTAAFVAAAYLALEFDPTDYLLYDSGLAAILLVTLSILLGLYLHDLYSQVRIASRVVLAQQLCLVMGLAFLLEGLISFVNPDLRVPIRVMLLGSLLAVAAIFVWRLLFSAFVIRVVIQDRLLLVGSSPVLADLDTYVDAHPESGFVVAGCVGPSGAGGPLPAGKMLGPLGSLADIVDTTRPSRLVVGLLDRSDAGFANQLLGLTFAGNAVEDAAGTYERISGRVSIKGLRPPGFVCSREFEPSRQRFLYQSLSNAALAFLGILVALPVMLLTALAVRFRLDRRPRAGLGNRPFTLYRFRAGRSGAGRIVRKLHLDGLPQLINVLKGEMSIVGPRPQRPEFVAAISRYIPFYRQRHSVRPGLTGWGQLKSPLPLEDAIAELEYDLYYIKHLSLGLDTFIMFHALKSLLESRDTR